MRNEFNPEVTDRGGSSSTHKKFKRYEEKCLRAPIEAFAKAQANRHLSRRSYGPASGARTIPTSKKQTDRKQGRSGTGIKAPAQQKYVLITEGSFLKGKGKEAVKPKKQARFEADVGSESDGWGGAPGPPCVPITVLGLHKPQSAASMI